MGNAVEARALSRSFGDKKALVALDLDIARGEIVGVLGPNGAGKSTTIKILTTLLPPTSGTAHVAGFDVVTEAREVRRRVGYVPQLVSADGTLTARENLDLSAKLHALPKAERLERVTRALEFMNLVDVADALVRTYSGGMIRRLEIAQAMLHRPAVLFLDEPTVGLDPVARHTVWDRLLELRRDLDTAVLLTTHDMDEADALCDRIALMHKGSVAVTGAPSALKAALGPTATLEDVFVHHTGAAGLKDDDAQGGYRDAARTRVTAKRLG